MAQWRSLEGIWTKLWKVLKLECSTQKQGVMRTPFTCELLTWELWLRTRCLHRVQTCHHFRKDCGVFGIFVSRFIVILLPPEGTGLSAVSSPPLPIPSLTFRHGYWHLVIDSKQKWDSECLHVKDVQILLGKASGPVLATQLKTLLR